MATTTKTKHLEWRESNPLRVWRNAQELSLMNASAVLECAVSTLQSWEYGVTDPNFTLLAGAMKVSEATLRRQWANWARKSPNKRAR